MFGSVFLFWHLETVVLWFWSLPRFAGFLEFSLWFSVFVNSDGGFSGFFLSSTFYGFSGFAKEVTSHSRAKTSQKRNG